MKFTSDFSQSDWVEYGGLSFSCQIENTNREIAVLLEMYQDF